MGALLGDTLTTRAQGQALRIEEVYWFMALPYGTNLALPSRASLRSGNGVKTSVVYFTLRDRTLDAARGQKAQRPRRSRSRPVGVVERRRARLVAGVREGEGGGVCLFDVEGVAPLGGRSEEVVARHGVGAEVMAEHGVVGRDGQGVEQRAAVHAHSAAIPAARAGPRAGMRE